jgi:carbonic anhydrase
MRIRTYPLLPKGLEVVGAIYHVENGQLEKIY